MTQPPQGSDVREALPYSTPMELWQAFKRGEKFVLHYHGRTFDVTNMSPREKVVYVQPPGMPVKVYPDGSNCESAGDAIWLERAALAALPPAQAEQPAGRGPYRDKCAADGHRCLQGCRTNEPCYWTSRNAFASQGTPSPEQGEAVTNSMVMSALALVPHCAVAPRQMPVDCRPPQQRRPPRSTRAGARTGRGGRDPA